jgi:CRISPR associated protein Cas1
MYDDLSAAVEEGDRGDLAAGSVATKDSPCVPETNRGGIDRSQHEKSCDTAGGGSPLEGGLLFISEPDTALQIRQGALGIRYRDGVERTFPRGRHRLRSIMLASPGANVTIEAMRFDEGITIFVMHRAGEALAVLTDAPTTDTSAHALELRRAQFAATQRKRLEVARAILAMKVEACELPEQQTQDAPTRGIIASC